MKHRVFLTAILMIAMSITTNAVAQNFDFSAVAPTGQTLYYKITSSSNHTAKVTHPASGISTNAWNGYTKPTGTLTIPSTVSYNATTYTITAIDSFAFYQCQDLTGSLVIPNTVTSIYYVAFLKCDGFNGTLTLPNSVDTIGKEAFEYCSGFTGQLTIPNSVICIGANAFGNCSGFTGALNIPNSVRHIGSSAFRDCDGLTSVYIPSSVTLIEQNPFYTDGSSGLTSIVVDGGNSYYDSRNNCNAIIKTSTNTLVSGCQNTVIPTSVTSIGSAAFGGCRGLTGTLSLHNGITSIGSIAFCNCSGLTGSLTIPNSVRSIGKGAFDNCTGLTGTLTIPNSVTTIGNSTSVIAFDRCPFTSIVVDGGNSVYDSRNNCNAIIHTATNTLIYGCQSTVIPNTVQTIGTLAFNQCSGLMGELVIPNSVTTIRGSAFMQCRGLTSIILGSNVDTIETWAFWDCSNVRTIKSLAVMPPVITGSGAYSPFASGVTSATLYVPCGSEAAYRAASGWSSFTNIQCINVVTVAPSDTSHGSVSGGGIFAPGDTATLTAVPNCGYMFTQWSDGVTTNPRTFVVNADTTITAQFTAGTTKISQVCSTGQTLYYTLDCTNNTATVTHPASGTYAAAWLGYTKPTDSLSIPNSVTYNSTNYTIISIDQYAFFECSGITAVSIPPTVTYIGSQAFCRCGITGTLTIPNSVSSIVGNPFLSCTSITAIVVESGNPIYDSRGNCNAIIKTSTNTLISGCKNTIIPNDVRTIGSSAFYGCTSLISITIPNSVTNISSSAFSGCSGLTSMSIPNSVRSIGHNAFHGCIGLTSITIPISVTSIGMAVFAKCDSLATIVVESGNSVYDSRNNCNAIIETSTNSLISGCKNTIIPNTVISIAIEAFYLYESLTSITIPNAVDTIALQAFAGCYHVASITSLAVVPPRLGSDALGLIPASRPVYVPCGSEAAYRAAPGWSNFTNIQGLPVYTDTSATACNSYTWAGNTYSQSGTYTNSYTNANGCSVTDTLHLTIRHSTTSPDAHTACDNYRWIDGNSYTASNSTATHTLTNAAGCDSTVTLHLTINHSSTGTETVTACNNYTWHGRAFAASTDTATYRTTNAAGCDSTATLHLTINHSSTGTATVTACNSYTWHGRAFSASTDTATYRTTNAAGCDSTATLHLTINHSTTGTETVTACNSYTWHGKAFSASTDTATYRTTNAAGCDSTATLHLTINHSTTGSETVTACNSYTWHGRTFTASTDTATYRTTNAAGCDSTTTLHLTINQCSTTEATACDSYTWLGTAYTTSGTYTSGTDTLVLTINHSTTGSETVTACNSYTWHGRDFSASTDTATYRTTNAAGCDSTATLHLTINQCSTTEATACDSYTWHGTAYTTSGTYTSGTDTLVLTINHSTTGTDTITACNSYTWHGRAFSASTDTATYHTTNAAGCDSTATLHLTINQCSTTETTACDSYTWLGTAYTTSGTYTSGTDTLVLTINHSTTGAENITACNSYTWHGRDFSASTDTATYRTTNAAGCDSTVTLHLTINQCSTTEATACGSYTWHGTVYTTSGTYTSGTDTLVLTINHSTTGSETVTACNSYTWHGRAFSASTDTATYRTTNAAGCDSTTTLHLTINQCSTTEATACDSYTWHGTAYTTSGTYTSGTDTLVLTINHSTTGTKTVTACNSYTWHGRAFTASTDTATYRTTNAAGCDSTATLHLTINQCSTTEATACDSYTWHGTAYTTSGTYTSGTDTLVLTINHSTTGTETVTACNSYTWHGRAFSASTDTATYRTTNAAGCDSTTTLHLTVYHDSSTSYTVSEVGSYTWTNHGTSATYTQSGTYTNSYRTADGCAGTDTLHLTITTSTPTQYHTVRVLSSNNSMGHATVTGNSRVQHGRTATVRANPSHHYRFVRWSNGATANPYTFTVVQDTVLTAIFSGSDCTVTILNGNPGRGIVNGSGTAAYGSRRNIAAAPNHGYRFDRWSDGDSNASRTITVTGDITLTAYFGTRQFRVDAQPANYAQGAVSGGGSYDYQAYATLTATPANGYVFHHWSDGDSVNPRRIQVLKDTTFTAYFVRGVVRHTLTAVSADPTMGSVSGGGTYEEGTTVTIAANASSGYEFASWTDGVTTNPRSVTITSDTAFTATFRAVYVPQDYTVTLTSNNASFGRVSGSGTYREGSTAYISAYPSAHCHFVRWSDGNATAQRTLTVTSDITLTATFAPDSVEIVARANDGGLGRVAGGGLYAIGDEATLTATPNSGSRFLRWSTGEREQTITITVRYAATYTAIFERTTQGIDEAESGELRAWSHAMTIHVAGLTGQPVKVYDLTGRLVAERTAAHGDMVIPVTHPGLYLVQTGTVTHKVLTR